MAIGLSLSGGGAKGIAHIGVIEALNDNKISIDYIAGTSSGSIIAGLYAAGYTPNEIISIIIENAKKKSIIDYDKKAMFKLLKIAFTNTVSIKGFVKGDKLENLLDNYLMNKGIKNIEDVKMPLAIPVVNIKTGEIVYYSNIANLGLVNMDKVNEDEDKYIKEKDNSYDDIPTYKTEGRLSEIIRASCSFPAVFKPKKIGKDWFVDGGVRVNTPVKILREMGADKVIAVSFNCNKMNKSAIKNIVGITSQTLDILMHESSEKEQDLTDINVRICLKNVSLLDFNNPIGIAKNGYNLVNNNIEYIKRKLEL